MLLKDKHIFLVEDDPVNFAVIRTILRKNGAVAPLDTWADTTLSRIKEYSFGIDLILLDLMFPGNTTGYDVYDAIKSEPGLESIPVAIVSAADPDVEIPRAKEKGLDGFISKPINRHRFPKQVIAIMEGESVWGSE